MKNYKNKSLLIFVFLYTPVPFSINAMENEQQKKLNDQLIEHVKQGASVDQVQKDLAAGAEINTREIIQQTPLHLAAFYGHNNLVKFLLENKADVNAIDKNQNTALTVSLTGHGNTRSVITYLLQHGARAKNATEQTRIDERLKESDAKQDSASSSKGAQTRTAQSDERVVISSSQHTRVSSASTSAVALNKEATIKRHSLSHQQLLDGLTRSSSIDLTSADVDDKGNPVLYYPVREFNEDDLYDQDETDPISRYLAETKSPLNPKDATIFLLNPEKLIANLPNGAWHEDVRIVSLLIARNANVNEANEVEQTSLIRAAAHGRNEIVQTLLDSRANPNAADKDGYVPLHFAAEHGHSEIAKILVEGKANINHTSNNKINALRIARRSKKIDCLKTLLSLGATPQKDDTKTQELIQNLKARTSKPEALEHKDDSHVTKATASTSATPTVIAGGIPIGLLGQNTNFFKTAQKSTQP